MPDDNVVGQLPHWTKFLWAYRQLIHPRPALYEIDLTNYCNLKCTWCINSSLRMKKPKNMKMRMIYRIILSAMIHHRGITITGGGESTLHPKFRQIALFILNQVRKRRIPSFGLVSNGYNVDGLRAVMEYINWFKFKENHIPFWVRISLNDRDIPPNLLKLFKDFPGQIGSSFVYGNDYEYRLCQINAGLLRRLDLCTYYRVKPAHDFTQCHEPDYYKKCIGRKLHRIHEPDGNIPYCCMARGSKDPPVKCPLSCPWGKPDLNFAWDVAPFS